MSKIERIQKYIQKTKIERETMYRYGMTFGEMDVLLRLAMTPQHERLWDAISLTYHFGMAKGYRAAKAKMRGACNE